MTADQSRIEAKAITCSELAVGIVDLKTGIVTNWRGVPNGARITEFCGHQIPVEDRTALTGTMTMNPPASR